MSPWAKMQAQAQAVNNPDMEGQMPTPEEMALTQDPEALAQAQALAEQGSIPQVPGTMPLPANSPRALAAMKKLGLNPSSDYQVTMNQRILDMAADYDRSIKQDQAMNQGQIQNLQENINQYANRPLNTDVSAAAPFVDFLNQTAGQQSHFAGNVPHEMTAPEKEQNLMGLREKLMNYQQGLNKEKISELGQQISAYKAAKEDPLKQALELAKLANQGNSTPEERLDSRLSQQAHNQVVRQLNSDPVLRTKLQQIQGIDNAGKIIEEAPVVTPAVFDEYQQALVGAIARGNTSVGERAHRYMSSMGIDENRILQYLSGQPMGVSKDDPLLKTAQGFAKTERGNIQKQYNQILDTSIQGSGQQHVYDKHPEMYQSLKSMVGAKKGLVAPEVPGSGGFQEGDTKSWNGKNYILEDGQWNEE